MKPQTLLKIKITATVLCFLGISLFVYRLLDICRTKQQLVLVAALWLLVLSATVCSLVYDFIELRRWKKISVLVLSLLLASTFCSQSVAPIFPSVSIPHHDDSVTTVTVGRIDKDGKLFNQDGTPVRDDNGNQLVVLNALSKTPGVGAIDANGNLTVPKFTLCEAIVGMIVIGVGTYIMYKVYVCAKKVSQMTNSPPTNDPYGINGDNSVVEKPVSKASPVQTQLTADSSQLTWDDSVVTNGWVDWTGSVVVGVFEGAITNSYLTNSDGSTTLLTWQSSSNLINWQKEYLYVNGWVSATPSSTNITTIVYDALGNPFSTNWYRNGEMDGQIVGVPIRNAQAMFYKVSP
jgi:hypothetical protein